MPAGNQCLSGTSDGSGNVGLQYINVSPALMPIIFYDRSGTVLGSIATEKLTAFEQLRGFVVNSGIGNQFRSAITPTGRSLNTTGQTGDQAIASGLNPLGGAVFATFPQGAPAVATEIVNYDDLVQQRFRVPAPLPNVAGVGVDRLGRTLVVGFLRAGEAPNSEIVQGVWLDASGVAGETFLVGTGLNGPLSVVARAGSGVFVQDAAGTWLAQVDSLAAHASPAPAWLATRPGSSLHGAHNGTAYAVGLFSGAACNQEIEVISASGKSCGKANFGCAAIGSRPTVGYEGTVILNVPSGSSSDGTVDCRWHWWPGFFH